eukprot:4159490-Pleurochrysis_carterae.AAC.3
MLVIAWCAHVGSLLAPSSPRTTRRATLRAAAARSFIVEAGAKLRMRGSKASVMPLSRRSAAVCRRGEVVARERDEDARPFPRRPRPRLTRGLLERLESACDSEVLLWSMVKSSAVAVNLPSASRRERSWARYLVCTDSAPSEMIVPV